MPVRLAISINRTVASRTWLTLPGAEPSSPLNMVNRVHHQHFRPDGIDHRKQRIHLDLGDHQQAGRNGVQPLAPQADLADGLLAGNIEHPAPLAGQSVQRLKHQGGLADAGVAADQHQRAGYQSASQYAVELPNVG